MRKTLIRLADSNGVLIVMVLPITDYMRPLFPEKKNPFKVKTILMHTIILGNPPEGMEIDHVNRDSLDNRRENLRFVTRSQNIINSSRLDKAKHIQRHGNKYRVRIMRDRKQYFIGAFPSIEEAIIARDLFLHKNGEE